MRIFLNSAASSKLLEFSTESCALIRSINGVIKDVELSQSLIGEVRLPSIGMGILDKSFAAKVTQSSSKIKLAKTQEAIIHKLRDKDWVVYCKPPFGSAEKVVQYLGTYTPRGDFK